MKMNSEKELQWKKQTQSRSKLYGIVLFYEFIIYVKLV